MPKSTDEVIAKLEADLKKEEEVFYSTLGRAIVAWSRVEWALFEVFLHALGCPDAGTASASYYSTTAFRAKLRMTHEPMFVRFGKHPVFDQWKTLSNKLGRKADIRNSIAHSTVVTKLNGGKGKKVSMLVGVYNTARHPVVTEKPRTIYHQADMGQFVGTFNALATVTSAFAHRLETITRKPAFRSAT